MSRSESQYAEAKEAQTFFRDVIELCMAKNVDGLKDMFEKYLEKHSQVSGEDVIENFRTEGKTILHVAASSGSDRIVGYFLSHCQSFSAIINEPDNQGFTPLINATISENESSMLLIIQQGGDVNAQNHDGAAAVHFAAADGSISRLELLKAHGANLNLISKSGTTIHWASGKGHSDAIKFLIDNNVDVNGKNDGGLPAVIMAAAARTDMGVKHLVDARADVGLVFSGNLTLLHLCAEYGLYHAVSSILENEHGRACLSIATDDGNLPINLAAMSNDRTMVEILLPVSLDLLSAASVDELLEDGAARMKAWEDKHVKHAGGSSLSCSSEASWRSSPSSSSSTRILEPCIEAASTDAADAADRYKEEGNSHYKAKNFHLAIESYSAGIRLQGNHKVLWSNRSACFLTMNQPLEALRDAEVCRQLDPTWPKGCYRLGAARLGLGLYEDAAVAAFEGCKLDDTNSELKTLLQKAVKLGQEHHRKQIQETGKKS